MRYNPDDLRSKLESLARLGDRQAALDLLEYLQTTGGLDDHSDRPDYPFLINTEHFGLWNLRICPLNQNSIEVFTGTADDPRSSTVTITRNNIPIEIYFRIEFSFLPRYYYFGNREDRLAWIPIYRDSTGSMHRTFKFKQAGLAPEGLGPHDLNYFTADIYQERDLVRIFGFELRQWVKFHPAEMRLSQKLWTKSSIISHLEEHQSLLQKVTDSETKLADSIIELLKT